MVSRVLLLCLTVALAGSLPAAGQREIKWNNPDGPALPGVEHGSFRSAAMGVEVGYNVYTPPGAGNERLPVIYFLHGAGGTENSDAGAFSGLVGKLIDRKEIAPAICVFPNGGMSGYQDREETKVMGETLIIKELIPQIDRTHRTRSGKDGRVIAGFSMGGAGAVRLSLKHPKLFSAAASWAGALPRRGVMSPPELEVANLKKVGGSVRLLLIVGDQDFTKTGHQPLLASLQEAEYPVRYEVLAGVGHNLGLYYEKSGEDLVRFLAKGF
jgi:S-formylglutathione hydrolase FrmB